MRLRCEPLLAVEEERQLDDGCTGDVTADEVGAAAKGMSVDSAAAPDRVLVCSIEPVAIQEVIAVIVRMCMWEVVPPPKLFCQAKTVLIPKETVQRIAQLPPYFSVSIRLRLLERVLDWTSEAIKKSVVSARFTSSPRVQVNASIVGSCLEGAIKNKESIFIVMLDIQGAFEEIPHDHPERTLAACTLLKNVRNPHHRAEIQ